MNRLALWLACCCGACGFGNSVEQFGNYESVPTTYVTDSAVYPLASLLIVEQDLIVEQTRLYCFRGDLRRADLGFQDLRRIATTFGSSAIAFDLRREHLDAPEEREGALQAEVGEDTIALQRLDDEGLFATGARRYLTSVSSPDYAVSAYFGVIEGADPLPAIRIEQAGIDFEPKLDSAALEPEAGDERIQFTYEASADYVIAELLQGLQRRETDDDAPALDGLVRTTLAPGTPYIVSSRFMSVSAGQSCWSRERAITMRLRQVARRYQQAMHGAWAVIHERSEGLELEPAAWTALASDVQAPGYCQAYE